MSFDTWLRRQSSRLNDVSIPFEQGDVFRQAWVREMLK